MWALLVLLALCWPAEAGDVSDCEGNNLNRKIAACSRLIESGQLDGKALASAHNNRGVGFIRTGRNTLAITEFDAASRIDPEHYKARQNRGSAYMENGQFDKALSDYKRAIELKPDWARAYGQRGLVYFFQGAFKHALADLNKAIDLKPDGALIYNNRGVVHESMGLVEKAIADYRKALALDPSLGIAEINLLNLLGDAVSAGYKGRQSTRPAEHCRNSTLVPLSTLDSVRFGLQTRPSC
jgi:tetratricopeptide (TPR) repeat protein